MGINDYYQSYYKHPQNEYDPRYFDLPPKECKNCICYFCYNKLCPHCVGYRYSLASDMCVKDKKIRSKDMIPHRCDKCYFLWHRKNRFMIVISMLIFVGNVCCTHLFVCVRKNGYRNSYRKN